MQDVEGPPVGVKQEPGRAGAELLGPRAGQGEGGRGGGRGRAGFNVSMACYYEITKHVNTDGAQGKQL